MTRKTFSLAAVTLLVFFATGCGDGPASGSGGNTVDLSGAVPATFEVHPGVEQVTVTGAAPRSPLTLVTAGSRERLVTLYTDDLGQLTVPIVPGEFLVHDVQTQGLLPLEDARPLAAGRYRFVGEGIPGESFSGKIAASAPFDVLGIDDVPDASAYEGQELNSVPSAILGGTVGDFTDEEGYGYLRVRDGTLLSVNVRLPDPALYGRGP
ncbi:MAG: hypothetical protein FJ148_18140 [Deltaproteobacteria bacterium]|nr:hypothetical protein [Deltaproteobacteria bacterium]